MLLYRVSRLWNWLIIRLMYLLLVMVWDYTKKNADIKLDVKRSLDYLDILSVSIEPGKWNNKLIASIILLGFFFIVACLFCVYKLAVP